MLAFVRSAVYWHPVFSSIQSTVVAARQASWKLLSNLHGHSRYVTCCAFSPDGRLLVSGSNDKTVRLQSLPAADGAAPVTPLARARSDSRPNRQVGSGGGTGHVGVRPEGTYVDV